VDGSSGYLLSLLYLAVFGSIVGFGSYLTLLGRVGAGRAGYAMVMFPVVAIGTSVVMGESQPGIEMIVGVALVMAGNLLVLGQRRRITRRAEQQA
jgi:drug/metabolite transporter (DMT)-like permease